jgi:aspartate kinase
MRPPETPAVVMKFGGTSVADAEAMGRVLSIVRSARESGAGAPVVVVSATSGTTDQLLTLAAAAQREGAAAVAPGVEALVERHRAIVAALTSGPRAETLSAEVAQVFEELRAVLTAIGILGDASPRSSDMVAAVGELVSSRIVAAAFEEAGVPAAWVDARRALVTDDAHGAAAPQAEATRAAVAREIAPHVRAGRVPVLGGFVAATAGGVTTTLGRGGSDYSAALVGAALHGLPGNGDATMACREIQIWTDVDGMLTADPRVVESPAVVAELSFAEASELAYFGAKVLHPSTILPAVSSDIPVRILNSRRPQNPGTRITATPTRPDRPLTALACKRRVTVVEITSTRMLMAHGFLRRLFQVFETHRTPVDVVTTSEVSVSVTVDDDRRLPAIVADLEGFAGVTVEREMAILCAVGDNLRADPRLTIRLLAALEGTPLRMVSQSASRRNVTVVLNDRDVPAAMGRLHAAAFEGHGLAAPGAAR